MKEFRIRSTGQIITEAEFRASSPIIHPELLTPAILDQEGLDPILPGPRPAVKEFETLERTGIEQDPSGHWLEVWDAKPWLPEQIAEFMAQARRSKELEINQWRAEANLTHFPFRGKLIARDDTSRSDIDTVANHINLTGEFPEAFPNAWKTLDNSYVPLPTIEDFKDMYRAMSKQGTANFARAQNLKLKVAQAVTTSDLNSITWDMEL